jgi:hypothetical protein
MIRLRLSAMLALGAAVAACSDNTAAAPHGITAATTAAPMPLAQTFSMPVRATTTTAVTGCDNSPGPYITIEGGLALGGLGSQVRFTNNAKGTHDYSTDTQIDVELVPGGGSITIPKQPVLGGVGGNPFIWIKFEDGNGNALSDEIYLGRCVQGLTKTSSLDFASLARAVATLSASGCENNPGPYITLDGELDVAAGLDVKFIFQNNDNPVNGPHEATADNVVKVLLVPPGQTIRFSKQPSQGGVGGNPWIYFQFLTGAGAPIGQEALVGRCVQLSS